MCVCFRADREAGFIDREMDKQGNLQIHIRCIDRKRYQRTKTDKIYTDNRDMIVRGKNNNLERK